MRVPAGSKHLFRSAALRQKRRSNGLRRRVFPARDRRKQLVQTAEPFLPFRRGKIFKHRRIVVQPAQRMVADDDLSLQQHAAAVFPEKVVAAAIRPHIDLSSQPELRKRHDPLAGVTVRPVKLRIHIRDAAQRHAVFSVQKTLAGEIDPERRIAEGTGRGKFSRKAEPCTVPQVPPLFAYADPAEHKFFAIGIRHGLRRHAADCLQRCNFFVDLSLQFL